MRNFGELPFGEIPEPLKYNRPFSKYLIHALFGRIWSVILQNFAIEIFTYLL